MPPGGDRRRLPRPRPPGARSRTIGTQPTDQNTPSKTRSKVSRKRKSLSVYLDPFEAEFIQQCAMERQQDVSWFLREAGMFEAEHRLSELARSARAGDPEAAKLIVRTALGLAGLHPSDLQPVPEPIEVIRYVPAPASQSSAPPALPPPAPVQSSRSALEQPSAPVEPIRFLPAERPAAMSSRSSPRQSAVSQIAASSPAVPKNETGLRGSAKWTELADWVVDALSFCWKWVIVGVELIALLLRMIGELVLSAVRGWMRGGRTQDDGTQQPERWSTGAVLRLLALVVVPLLVLPVESGPGAVGYFLLGGDETALAEATQRSPAHVRRRMIAGWIATSSPENVEAIEKCERRSKRQDRPVTCKVSVRPTHY